VSDALRNPLNILLVTPTLGRDGGVATHVLASTRALVAAGHSVVIAAGEVQVAAPDGSDAVHVPGVGEASPDRAVVTALADVCRDRSPTVVHLHDVAPHPFVDALRRIAPVVSSAHGYSCCSPNTYYFSPGHECSRQHGPGCLANMVLRGCAHTRDPRSFPTRYRDTTKRRRGLHAVDAAVAYSSATARQLRNNQLRKVHQVRLFSETPLRRSPIPSDRRVLFVGRVVPAKGVDVLLDAMSRTSAELEIHGDGWWMPEARAMADRLGVSERVQFHGWSDADVLADAYRRARAVVVPSVWPEPFGLIGLEAMSQGRPVIASETGGIVDWLHHGETGLGVAPGDSPQLAAAMEEILAPGDLAERLADGGARLVSEHFTSTGHVADLEATYEAARHAWDQGAAPRQRT
jgi:glycosyltransferase involved in cell wall biosynthesis